MADCVFCAIVAKTSPANVLYEDEHVVAFEALDPAAPLHALVVPRKHVALMADMDDAWLTGHVFLAAARVAKNAGRGDNFRLVVNNGDRAGQSVFHLHVHVLGGRSFSWPPG